VDMGADEFARHLYMVGVPTPGSWITLRFVGYPGDGVLLGLGSGINPAGTWTNWGWFYLVPPFMKFQMGAVPGNGILVVDVQIPTGAAVGNQYPLQALVGTSLTNYLLIIVE